MPPSLAQEPPPAPDDGRDGGPPAGQDTSYDTQSTMERADTGRIGSLFVRPEYRRRGIGRALMTSALAEFWRRGIRRVVLDTDADNPTGAPRLYRRFGLRPYRHELVLEREVRPGREVRVAVNG